MSERPLSSDVSLLLWVGVAGFALGTVAVAYRASGVDGDERTRLLAVVAVFVPLSVGTWYVAMALGWAVTRTPAGVVHWGRFADGVLTLPLVCGSLAVLAGADRVTAATAAAVAGHTMATTLAATLATGTAKLVWLGIGVGGFLALLWLLFGPVTRAADGTAGAARFGRVRNAVVAAMCAYPVVWVLGPEGFALAPGPAAPAGVALDLAFKIGFGLLLAGAARRGAGVRSDRAATA
jgi:bacteriorhodopsin